VGLTRVFAVSDPSAIDPIYAEGLRGAGCGAIEYSLGALELGALSATPPGLAPGVHA
jgi:hypothetical protein